MTFLLQIGKGWINIIKDFRKLFIKDSEDFFLFDNVSNFVVCGDRGMYNRFKDGLLTDIDEKQSIKIKILSLLEAYGFPMDELGTYFYKDIIAKCYDVINSKQDENYFNRCGMLLEELKNPYSNFYFDLARNDNDIGTTTFHLYIEKALNLVDEGMANPNLPNNIFGTEVKSANYGIQAYQLASFISKLYLMDSFDAIESGSPMTLKLSNNRNIEN